MFLPLGLLLAGFAPGFAHIGSRSVTRVQVRDTGLEAVTQLQILSLLEVYPELDGNEDGFVDPEEVGAAAGRIGEIFAADYRLASGGQALPLRTGEASLVPPDPGAPLGLPEWIELRWGSAAPEGPLEVRSQLFLETSPDHTDTVVVQWPGRLPAQALLGLDRSAARLEPGEERWKAWGRAFAREAWSSGLLVLVWFALLAGVERSRLRYGHAAVLAVGLGCGAYWANQLAALPGGHLLPLVAVLGAAYCAIDRAAFGMQRAHLFEALVVALSWGASLRVPFGLFELEPLPARLGPALAAAALLAAGCPVARWVQGRPARALVALAGAAALAQFLLLAFG